MPFNLPDLPYPRDALEPHISSRTIDFHYGKHHSGYVDKLNKATEGTAFADASLEKVILETRQDETQKALFNNAAQVWNHTLYWHSMTPGGGGEPGDDLADLIKEAFGTFSAFKDAFKSAGTAEFGSGWVWLVYNGTKLEIQSTTDAEIPTDNLDHILLTMDVWEHAYYLDQQNARGDYIDAFLNKLVNWQNAADRLRAVDLQTAA
ncbi:MAG: superoxide dismutase [Alphaproteobacteria bacterium]